MKSFFKNDNGVNWRYFPLFLLIVFIIAILLIYLLIPSFFTGPEIRRIPIIINEEPDKVEDAPLVFVKDYDVFLNISKHY